MNLRAIWKRLQGKPQTRAEIVAKLRSDAIIQCAKPVLYTLKACPEMHAQAEELCQRLDLPVGHVLGLGIGTLMILTEPGVSRFTVTRNGTDYVYRIPVPESVPKPAGGR